LPPDVRRGLARAHITITVPVMWLGVMSLPVPLAMALDHGRPGSGALPFLLGFLLGFLLWMGVAALCAGLLGSWLTPRWRVWCLRHVEDIALLEVEAVERGLLPPPDDPFGRWLTPRERWTPALRAEAARLRRGRGGPAWSGEM
jgi:hypothetical protein